MGAPARRDTRDTVDEMSSRGNSVTLRKRRLTQVSLASLALAQNIRDENLLDDGDDDTLASLPSKILDFQDSSYVDERKSPWFSLWLANAMQCMCGIQFSIYMMSMWPYLSQLDDTADLTFLGWIIASYSVGQAVASPAFGIWNQRTLSTKWPVALGLLFCVIGNLLYALLQSFTISGIKWIMLVARFIVGLGSGNYAVLRSYTASASVKKDRTRAIALATGAYVLGMSFGPAIQMIFTPINEGFVIANSIHINMFTCPAYAMVIINLISMALVFTVFKEEYAGILTKADREGKAGEYFVLPKMDVLAAVICIYMFFVQNCVSTVIETLSSPISMAMYNYDDQQTIVFSGVAQAVSSAVEIVHNILLAFTPLGRVNPRYLLIVGLLGFSVYHIILLPYPFYTAPLVYTNNTDNGGCYYEWCKTLPQVPQPLYWIGYVMGIGTGFPYVANPTGTLFSEGIMALFGSIARVIAPIFATALFESSGYTWPMVIELVLLSFGIVLTIVFWKRLVPLKFAPAVGKSLRYKNGIFYKM